ncbi:MAG: FHA domain-containing protein [Planctomycetaceae bacterium]
MVATLMLSKGSQEEAFREFVEGQTIVVGAAADCDIVLQDWLIAARHFSLTHKGRYFEINVLDHLVAVLVNGVSIESGRIHHRDIINVGYFELVLKLDSTKRLPAQTSLTRLRTSVVVPKGRSSVPFPVASTRHRPNQSDALFDPSVSIVRVGDALTERDSAHTVCQISPVTRQPSELN